MMKNKVLGSWAHNLSGQLSIYFKQNTLNSIKNAIKHARGGKLLIAIFFLSSFFLADFHLNGQTFKCDAEVVNNIEESNSTLCNLNTLTTADIASFPILIIKCIVIYEEFNGGVVEYKGENYNIPAGNFYPLDINDPNYWTDPLNGQAYAGLMLGDASLILSNFMPNYIQSKIPNYDPNWDFIGDSKMRFVLDPVLGDSDGIFYGVPSNISDLPKDIFIITCSNEVTSLAGGDTSKPIFPGSNQFEGATVQSPYLNQYIDKFHTKTDWGFWVSSGVVVHELFHHRGLCHTFALYNECRDEDIFPEYECNTLGVLGEPTCGGGDNLCVGSPSSESTNIMSYTNPGDPALSVCQAKTVWRNALGRTFRNSYDICDIFSPDLVLTSGNYVWNNIQFHNRNVVIEAGASLTINCSVLMGPNKALIVKRGAKLTINGGLVTSLCGENSWAGIFVEGNSSIPQPNTSGLPQANEAGIVVMLNNAKLENARTGISTSKYGEGWNENYWGGLISINNSIFSNNKKGIEFMKYQLMNKSEIKGTKFSENGFQNNSDGITIWSCNGIKITDNQFGPLDRHALKGIDSGVEVKKNKFANIKNAIAMGTENPAKSVALDIIENEFVSCSDYSIWLDGTSITSEAIVYKNYIDKVLVQMPAPNKNGTYGIVATGRCFASIYNNEINRKTFGLIAVNSEERNSFYCNEAKYNSVGMGYMGLNSKVKFSNNTFFATPINVFNSSDFQGILGELTLQTQWDQPNRDAKNCFGNADDIIANISNTVPFTYFLPPTGASGCIVPTGNLSDGGTNNYTTDEPEFVNNFDCSGGGGFQGRLLPYLPQSYGYYYNVLDSLSLVYSVVPTPQVKAQLQVAESNTDAKLREILNNFINSDSLSLLSQILACDGRNSTKKFLSIALFEKSRFIQASTMLIGIISNNLDDQYFKDVYSIKLQLSEQHDSVGLTSLQKTTLELIADTELPSSPYARALLSRKLGSEFQPKNYTMPIIERSSKSGEGFVLLKVVPNPVANLLQVNTNQKFSGSVRIFDATGRLRMLNQVDSTDGVIQMNTELLEPGSYFIQIPMELSVTTLPFIILR